MAFVVMPRIVKIHFADCCVQYLQQSLLENKTLEIDMHVYS